MRLPILAFLLSSFCLSGTFAAPPPNIIVIMADDLGYGDLGCYGAKTLQTPNIDQLAAEGLRFTSGYCSASTCTPTRFSFLTGTYAFRQKGTGVAPPNGPALIQPGTTTIASLMKQAGYATAVIGKWHLGLGDPKPDWNGELKPGPLEIGFDHCHLLPTTNDRVPQVYVHDHRVLNLDPKDPLWVGDKAPDENHPTGITHRSTLRMDWTHGHNGTIHNGIGRIGFYTGGMAARFRDEDLADEWVKRSNTWIEAHKDGPFFLFFAAHDIHVPRMPHERFQGKTKLGFRGDCIVEFDWCVGEIMKTLDRLKLAENTLIVLCSDNGPVLDDGYKDGAVEKLGSHQPAGAFSGGKYSVLEGGTRTPFITRWKGRVQPGVSEQVVCTIDLASSLAALTGTALPETSCRDSINVLPALLGEPGAKGRDHLLQQDNNGVSFGLRMGDWKLVRHKKAKGKSQAVVSVKSHKDAEGLHALYFLPDDPSEENDLSAKNPEKMQAMIAKLDALIAADRSR
ncbi:sulfatase family protein [Prosthecobacter fluviatilis]|uniref:Arylsulfatase n=1 Tax=Prosthecobacter fluviatilis TaxID=445931 RepID=A0ABW0KWR8_9BACT